MNLKDIHSFLTSKLNADSFSSLESTHGLIESLSEVTDGLIKITTTSNLYVLGDCLIEAGTIFKFRNDVSIPNECENLDIHCLPKRLSIRDDKHPYMILITHIPGITESLPVPCERPCELPEEAKQKLLQDIDLLLENRLALGNPVSPYGIRSMHYVPATKTIIFSNPEFATCRGGLPAENYRKKVVSLLFGNK